MHSMQRLFLVGCSRSGTTLLQSMMAAHSEIVSFPETHFLVKTLPINPILRNLKMYGKKDCEIIKAFLARHGYYRLYPFFNVDSKKKFSHKNWCSKLLSTLDLMACYHKNPACWLEKTPRHLHYINSLHRVDSNLKFIHMLRSGKDVVASMHLASKNNATEWGGERSIDKCIRWWNTSIKKSLKYEDHPQHFFVKYGDLVSKPQVILKEICRFISLSYESDMVTRFHIKAVDLIEDEEVWKANNTKPTLKKSNKLHKHFDAETITFIKNKVTHVNLDQLCNY